MKMINTVISAMLAKGWSYETISRSTGVNADVLKRGQLTDRQEDAVLRVTAVEARIDLDELLTEGEE